MKRLHLLPLLLFLLTACSNDDELPLIPENNNKYITGIDLSKSYLFEKPLPTFKNETFHALGYGYDVTGKYAHPDWIRKKVLDPQRFENDHYYDVIHHWKLFSHGEAGAITGTKENVRNHLLKKINIDTVDSSSKYKNIFKGVFDIPFKNDTTFSQLQYYYAVDSYLSCWYEHHFILFQEKDLLPLRDYLTEEFKADLISKSASEIIQLYGTHVMVDIEVGLRQDYYYRSSSSEDLKKRMIYASAKLLNPVPGIWMIPGPGIYYEKENIYFEYVNGIESENMPNAWMFDITNYNENLKFEKRENTIDEKNTVLVNWGSRSDLGPIIPIYEFISDTKKRTELQLAYQKYLNN